MCDDGSPQEYVDKVKEVCGRFGAILIQHTENQGIPAAWNHLVQSLDKSGEIIVLLNNDLIVPPQWLDVAVHFLDANKDNPHVGTMFWNPVNRVPKEVMRAWLPELTHTVFETREISSGKECDFYSGGPMEVKVGDGHGVGRVMCPCGCCFAFRREIYEAVGGFEERLTSFHEESLMGTRCAMIGRASWGFSFPRPYHTHGATFAANPELNASERMVASRRMYCELLDIPVHHAKTCTYFDVAMERWMTKIPPTTLKYLRPDYSLPMSEYKPADATSSFLVPTLVEAEGEFA